MDPKVIEMNNLRVLNDYLNQTIDVLVRGQRSGNGHTPGLGYSPFGPVPPTAGALGTDVVCGPGPYGFAGSPFAGSPFAAQNPLSGLPLIGAGYGTVDPYFAQRGSFGAWQQPWGQAPWTPIAEATRQAHVAQAFAARQSVLEAMCRCAGIPV